MLASMWAAAAAVAISMGGRVAWAGGVGDAGGGMGGCVGGRGSHAHACGGGHEHRAVGRHREGCGCSAAGKRMLGVLATAKASLTQVKVRAHKAPKALPIDRCHLAHATLAAHMQVASVGSLCPCLPAVHALLGWWRPPLELAPGRPAQGAAELFAQRACLVVSPNPQAFAVHIGATASPAVHQHVQVHSCHVLVANGAWTLLPLL
mmetsp:Transcript_23074/g.63712  ORF Transcript_23074/g.63712 Transcript_23074/m.63712 type:complete len:206 (-) Transcript_23074:521-1138(-)